MKLRCCPVCYRIVKPTVSGTCYTGTKMEIRYTIRCPSCMFGCDKVGSVLVDYDEETMNPIADDHGLRRLNWPMGYVYDPLNFERLEA